MSDKASLEEPSLLEAFGVSDKHSVFEESSSNSSTYRVRKHIVSTLLPEYRWFFHTTSEAFSFIIIGDTKGAFFSLLSCQL